MKHLSTNEIFCSLESCVPDGELASLSHSWQQPADRIHSVVPHATFGMIKVEKVPHVQPLDLQTSLNDPGTENTLVRGLYYTCAL